ncbi:MAG TPA: hypothetical protein VFK23_07675 [Nitrospirota bacterium]|nr:hypothetical protein [Nitrospirota bacterium]
MKCSFLTGTHVLTCRANKDINYIPSAFELAEYCLTEKAKMCPYPTLMSFGIVHQPGAEGQQKEKPHLKAA